MVNGVAINRDAAIPMWRPYTGKRLTIYVLEGSYAATRASSELRQAERVVAGLSDLLRPAAEHTTEQINIYLIDPVAETAVGRIVQSQAATTNNGGIIVRVVQPEAPGEPLAWPLTRLLIPKWFGSGAAVPLFVNGIAGVIAAQTGTGPTIADAQTWVREELKARRTMSIFVHATATSRSLDDAPDYAATAFIAFLIKEFGVAPLSAFLRAYDPERQDQAAIGVYQRTLGNLEEAWIGNLQRRARSGTAFRQLFQHLAPYIKPFWYREIEVLIYMGIGLAYSLVFPLGFKYLIDQVIPSGSLSTLLMLCVGLLVTYVVNSAVNVRRNYVTGGINRQILHSLRARMFERLQRLPHSFYTKAKIGDLLTRLDGDLDRVAEAMGLVTGSGVFLALKAVVSAVAVIVLSPLMGILVLIVVPVFAVSYVVLRSRLQQLSAEWQRLMGESASMEQENLSAHTVIKALGLEERSLKAYRARLQVTFEVFMRLVIVASLFDTTIGLAITLGQLIVVAAGGYLVITHRLSVGTLLAEVALLPSLFEPVGALANIGQAVEKASGALDRVDELIEQPLTITDKPTAMPLPPLMHEIRFADVTFGYDADRAILRDLTLTIPAGTHVSIVGPSGSGKSTVINLLLRFWDPDEGSVLFDGHDLRDVTLASVRGMIGIVFQDTFVFDSTLRDNIAIGRPDATDAEVVAAARAARLDTYITALPNGYDTVLGERGVMMSGGQRQRLAIARALLRDPRILILDEATSALDTQTEREILQTLDELARDRTTVSVTHRLALAATADCIVVLDKGRVIEQGTHAELVRAGGLYQRLYDEQVHPLAGGGAPDRVRVAHLQTIPLFSRLDVEALSAVAEQLEVEAFGTGEDVVRQGEVGDKMYIVSQGQVDVVVSDGESEQRVATLEAGDYFGEMALLAGEPRTATVRTTARTRLYSLAYQNFTRLLEREPKIRQAITDVVEARRTALAALVEAMQSGDEAMHNA